MNPNGVKLKKKTELNNTEIKKANFYETGICKKKYIYIYIHTHEGIYVKF